MALIALGVGAVTAFQRHTQRCTAAESKLAGLWDEPRKRAITEAFEKSGIPYANDVWRTVRGSLDVYARQWVAQHTEACEATWVTGVQTDAVLTLRMRCLNDRLDELRSLTDLLINADANTVKAAPKAMSSLTVLSQCSDIAALERRMPLPKNADQRRRIELVQHRLAEATSLIGVGRYQDALAAMEKVAADANELGYAPLQAAATRWLIQLNGRLGHYSVIRDLVFETVRLSELAGDDQIRFFGTVGLASLGIETGEPLEQLLTYCRLAENMLSRIKDNAYSAAKLEVIRGNVYLVRGNAEMAAESYRRGLEIAERSIPDSIELISDLNDNVALADLALHHTYRARDEGLKSVALLIQRVGPHHPDVAFSQANLANMYLSLHAPEQALAMADQAIATRLEVLGHEHTLFAEVMGSKGLALAQLGRYDEAERALRESLDIADRVAPEGTVVFETSSLFGEFYLLTHRPEEALKAFTRASALATKLESTLGPVQQLGQGLALLDLRRYAEAEARISAAMQGLLTLGSNDDLSRAHLALAELHWQRGDTKTARSLAEQALSDLATVEGDTNGRTARVRGWLGDHPAR